MTASSVAWSRVPWNVRPPVASTRTRDPGGSVRTNVAIAGSLGAGEIEGCEDDDVRAAAQPETASDRTRTSAIARFMTFSPSEIDTEPEPHHHVLDLLPPAD